MSKYRVTDELAADAYEWLEECGIDVPMDADHQEIARAVDRLYDGGWAAFRAANG